MRKSNSSAWSLHEEYASEIKLPTEGAIASEDGDSISLA